MFLKGFKTSKISFLNNCDLEIFEKWHFLEKNGNFWTFNKWQFSG